MLSYTDLGMALMVIAALIAAIALINRHTAPTPQTSPPMPRQRDHVRMLDDPGQSLGRRRDDGAGGES